LFVDAEQIRGPEFGRIGRQAATRTFSWPNRSTLVFFIIVRRRCRSFASGEQYLSRRGHDAVDVSDYPVGATHTSARVVHALVAAGEAGVTELARDLDLSKATVHSHLTTLERLGLVRSTDGRYRLGLRLLDLGVTVRDAMRLPTVARPEVTALAESSGESAALAVREDDEAAHADVRDADRNDRRVRLGSRVPLHATATGKVLLAFRDPDARDAYAADGLSRHTSRTVTDPADLRSDCRSIRDRGLAFDRGELFEGMRGVAAPVRQDESVVAAVGVLGPAERLSGKRLEEDLPGLVLSAAKSVELSLAD
jgi:DNA-binding IclR family transcriptional regulator